MGTGVRCQDKNHQIADALPRSGQRVSNLVVLVLTPYPSITPTGS